MSKIRNFAKALFIACLATAATLPQAAHAGSRYKVLERFKGPAGIYPSGPLIADSAGNLYGVTFQGGIKTCKRGCGVVYRIAADGTYSVLYAFQNHADGYWPMGNLLLDASGNLYGTTSRGGGRAFADGTVFKLTPDGTKTILHTFSGSTADGLFPDAGLIADNSGNLYGTTSQGGMANEFGGAIFKIAADGTESVLYSFCTLTNCADGQNPRGRLLLDSAGDLFGTTAVGGAFGLGAVFKFARNGAYKVLHSFGTQDDGRYPLAGVIADADGNLYGTTEAGGQNGKGVIFKVAPDGKETILYGLFGGVSELLLDDQGDLLGANSVIFVLHPSGRLRTLHQFTGRDGFGAATALTPLDGWLYGATQYGGTHCRHMGCGVAYRLKQ